MKLVVTTTLYVAFALGAAAAAFYGANRLIDAIRRDRALGPASSVGFVGLVAGVIIQNNGWLKLGGDAIGPLKHGWLTIVLGAVAGAALGYGYGRLRPGSAGDIDRLDRRWRAVVFAGPAIAFVTLGQVLPGIVTILLSFRAGRRGDGGATLSHYDEIFTDDDFFTVDQFDRIFTSRLFIVGLAGTVLAVIAAFAARQRQLGGSRRRRAVAINRVVLAVIGVPLLLALAGLIESIVWTKSRSLDGGDDEPYNASYIFDYLLTPLVQSWISLVVVVVAFFGGGLWYLLRHRAAGPSRFVGLPVVCGLLIGALGLALGLAGQISGAEMASSVLAGLGIAMLARIAVVDRYANQLEIGSPTSSLLLVGAGMLLALAVFSSLPSVLWNNLWWAVTVTGMSTALGLLFAILADRARGERAARTLIFLPMAISMVGAAVIWNFVYQLTATEPQTGLLNAALDSLGFAPRGFFVNSSMIPWNNFWIMLIMVWIQTGFAMVILSAAIKGVPKELLEAARVDGASEMQTFWAIVIPHIRSTIIVVVTTILIAVMKVFDLVKATTGGANSTNVLANEMFNRLRDANFASSSAFAVIIFLLVMPVMIHNIRTNLKELH